MLWCCGPPRSSCHVGEFSATRRLKTWINRARMLSFWKLTMETQSLMKCLFTHISFSIAGCNPSAISRLWSPLTIQIPSPPLAPSSPVSRLLPLLPHSPLVSPACLSPLPLLCRLLSFYYFSPSPLTSPSPRWVDVCLFNYSSLHPWRSEGWGVEAGEGKRGSGRMTGRKREGGLWDGAAECVCVGVCVAG